MIRPWSPNASHSFRTARRRCGPGTICSNRPAARIRHRRRYFGYTSRNASIFGPQLNIPGFVRVDAALYYNHELQSGNWLHAKQVNFAVNFRNLFDQGYIESAFNSTTRLFFGEPRTVLATVGLQF
jgi:outer membrane receptor protein involved in Fe transport